MNFKQVLRWAAIFGLAVMMLNGSSVQAGTPWDAQRGDWPYWRGPEMNGVSRASNIPVEWSPDEAGEDNLIWKSEDLAGRSTPIVMDGKLYTIVRDKPGSKLEAEKVVCVDAATGEEKWTSRFNVFLSDVPDTRVGWSCVVGDPKSKHIFALGVCGYFQCLDAETGKTIWSHSLAEEYGLLSTYGGRTNMPITYNNLVIISAVIIGWGEMAKPAHRFMAFDQRNGQMVWFNGTRLLPDDTTYSSPVLTSFNGQPAMVFASGDGGVHAFQPETGKTIWTYNVSARGINTTPIIVGNQVICGHSEENLDTTKMGALFCLDGTKNGEITKTGEVWRKPEMFVGKSSPLVIDDVIYACEDSGSLLSVDLKTGQELNKQKLGGPMRSSPLYVDGKIYLMTENGIWWVLQPTGKGKLKTLARARMRAGESHGSPIVAQGKLYVPTNEALYCIGNANEKVGYDKRPAPPKVAPRKDNPDVAQVQVLPVETLLHSGESQKLQIRLYNKFGQYLGLASEFNTKVTYEVEGVGAVENGVYRAPADNVTDQAIITVKRGDLTGTARIRVVPPFPWSYNFDNGKIPVPWVGIRYRHVPLDFDLLQKLKKENLLASELYIYLTTSFTNANPKAAQFDDSTARKGWTGLVEFMKIQDDAGSVDAAKAKLDPLLKILEREKIVQGWKWDTWSRDVGDITLKGVQLSVMRGPRKFDGNGVMMKITTIPKGMRSQGWMGHINQGNFTIEADVYGNQRDGKLPDMGLIGQRYTLDLMGASQQLQIRTWPPQLRMAQSVPFEWEPHVWYRMKFRTAVENGDAVLRGKVWKRGTPEPKNWTVEATDKSPNHTGSPGTFGNAKDAELFYDNIKVYSNNGN